METSTTAKDHDVTTEYDHGDQTLHDTVEERTFGAQLLPPLYSAVFVIGLIGNILMLLVLVKYKRLKKVTDIYLFNLAISDLIFLFTLPFWIDYKVKDDWVFGEAMCKLLSGLFFIGLYSEIFFIMLLTIHRTVSLSRTSSHLRTQLWFTHYTCSLHFPPESFRRWRQFLALKLNILGLILPLLVMIICYRPIIKILFRRRDKTAKATVRLIFVIMIAFFLFWTPYNLTVFVSAFQDSLCEHCSQLDLAIEVTEVTAYVHCCVNPIVINIGGDTKSDAFALRSEVILLSNAAFHQRVWCGSLQGRPDTVWKTRTRFTGRCSL
uniref:Uncharacterized protein n=1 Tax=Rangifer tarandus platyrhynchus TaxID=3082113 RepID=A0ACB0EIS7_RANTA|nr:unnamed protein product [Rangifer tarandus platyrhynchus]